MKQVSSSDMLAIRWHRDGHRSKFLNPTHIVQVTQPNPTRWKISFCNPTRPKIAQFPNHRNVICNNTLTKYIHAHVKANTSRISHSVWHRLHSLSLTTSDTVTTEHLRKTRSHPPPTNQFDALYSFFRQPRPSDGDRVANRRKDPFWLSRACWHTHTRHVPFVPLQRGWGTSFACAFQNWNGLL